MSNRLAARTILVVALLMIGVVVFVTSRAEAFNFRGGGGHVSRAPSFRSAPQRQMRVSRPSFSRPSFSRSNFSRPSHVARQHAPTIRRQAFRRPSNNRPSRVGSSFRPKLVSPTRVSHPSGVALRPTGGGNRSTSLAHLPHPGTLGAQHLPGENGGGRPAVLAHLPRPGSLGTPHQQGNGGSHPAGTGGGHPLDVAHLPRPNSIGSGGSHPAGTGTGHALDVAHLPRPNSIGTGNHPHDQQHVAGGVTDAAKKIQAQVQAANKAAVQKLNNTPKTQEVPKAIQAANIVAANQQKAKLAAEVAALQSKLNAEKKNGGANNGGGSASNAGNKPHPQIECIVAPCPTHFPTGNPSTAGGKDPGGKNPGGKNPGGNNPGGKTPGGKDPGGKNPGDNNPGGTDVGSNDHPGSPVVIAAPPTADDSPAPTVEDSQPAVTVVQPPAVVQAPADTSVATSSTPAPVVSSPSQDASAPAQVAAAPPNQDAAPQAPDAPQQPDTAPPGLEFVVVTFQQGVTTEDIDTFLKAYDVSVAEGPDANGLVKLRLSSPLSADQVQQVIDSMKSQTNIIATAAAG